MIITIINLEFLHGIWDQHQGQQKSLEIRGPHGKILTGGEISFRIP